MLYEYRGPYVTMHVSKVYDVRDEPSCPDVEDVVTISLHVGEVDAVDACVCLVMTDLLHRGVPCLRRVRQSRRWRATCAKCIVSITKLEDY